MALPGSHVFFLPAPQQEAGPLAEMDQCRLPSPVSSRLPRLDPAGLRPPSILLT